MSDIKGKNPKELLKLIFEKKNALQAFRLGNAGSKTKNVKEGRSLRKDIARMLTEINASKTVAGAASSVEAPKEAVVVKAVKSAKATKTKAKYKAAKK